MKFKMLMAVLLVTGFLYAEPYRENERVVFVGDSITHGGSYHTLIQYFYATHFPDRKVACFNVGISGDTAHGGAQRSSVNGDGIWERDVRMYAPTAAAVMLGMNDVGGSHFESSTSREQLMSFHEKQLGWYRANYASLLNHLEAQRIDRIALIKSSPYDQTMVNPQAQHNLLKFGFGKNDAIIDFGEKVIDEEAEKRGYPVCDFNSALLEINERRQQNDPAFTLVGLDRVHPGEAGHTVMGYTFLKFQGLEGPVAEVELRLNDPEKKWTVKNAVVSSLKTGAGQVQFDYTANALPMVRQSYEKAEGLIPFEEAFNREILRVAGLTDGMYRVQIGDKTAGRFSHTELDAGINLARLDTPQLQQSQKVYLLGLKQKKIMADIRSVVWAVGYLSKIKDHDAADKNANLEMIRRIDAGFEPEGLWAPPSDYVKHVLAQYVRCIDDYDLLFQRLENTIDKIYEMAQPMTHRVKIVKIK
ncbi:SGNH/GDSL hydrolase family protein [Pontiella agarivorans]|uniref:SGNH/GDSL hydrolase family protein n=1 Tax=Pontiella agarivorans TaxID=3038953 RepID=A0ABU5N1K3_9BACT|nr:SGNH/GDSL hydrolase family protein [Pontiella agarivorans]MDZ8120315.1 SGNH/GDSL hydrolase family protein [Pontiella agarivorans]